MRLKGEELNAVLKLFEVLHWSNLVFKPESREEATLELPLTMTIELRKANVGFEIRNCGLAKVLLRKVEDRSHDHVEVLEEPALFGLSELHKISSMLSLFNCSLELELFNSPTLLSRSKSDELLVGKVILTDLGTEGSLIVDADGIKLVFPISTTQELWEIVIRSPKEEGED